MDTSDRVFEWFRRGGTRWVVADWQEARQYHRNCHCENCGVVYAKRGGNTGYCPVCGSDATEPLSAAWEYLRDPWDDADSTEEVESIRITNY